MTMMDEIEVLVNVEQEVEARVSIWTLLDTINEQPMTSRWGGNRKVAQ